MGWTKLGERIFNALFGGGDVLEKEKVIIQKLKTFRDEKEIIMICRGLELMGSIYSFPTLLAFLKDDQTSPVERALQSAFDSIAFKYLSDDNLPYDYFSPEFWEPTWTGSKMEFLSLMTIIENVNPGIDEQDMERLVAAFVKELKVDISPYQTYRELKLCATDWDMVKDMTALLEGVETDILINSILEHTNIDDSSGIEDFIADQKNDYLLTRVKLFENFKANHYVLEKTACLNRDTKFI
jgi:hypothetical protein